MWWRRRKRTAFAGALLAGGEDAYVAAAGPLRDGPDVSWIPGMRAGDDQGQTDACVAFAIGRWIETVRKVYVPDWECVKVWRMALEAAGRTAGGLTVREGIEGWKRQGKLSPGARAFRAELWDLARQPLVGIYEGSVFVGARRNGCCDHHAPRSREFHAVLEVGHGRLTRIANRQMCYQAGSWGIGHGWKGFTCMEEWLHRERCRELWGIAEGP